MLREIKNFIVDDRFKIIILSDSVTINNYDKVLVFDTDRIIVKAFNKYIKILGNSLSIKRSFNKELFISGHIKSICMEDFYD